MLKKEIIRYYFLKIKIYLYINNKIYYKKNYNKQINNSNIKFKIFEIIKILILSYEIKKPQVELKQMLASIINYFNIP